jgi:adenine-specific DNA methylase
MTKKSTTNSGKGMLSLFQSAIPVGTDKAPHSIVKPVENLKAPAQATGRCNRALPVPNFSDPSRPLTCLEVDFPIAQINALSELEGNAGKPIYQMSKWWARRRSSVFRSMLIAAATEAPDDPSEAAKRVWEHYYCNHQTTGSFKKLKVLDCFMGGGTTLVEGSRLGMQMTGIDLNPVAWFVVKNELACSDPAQVKALFAEIEREVRPQVMPFYTTTCPRGHKGHWIDVETGEESPVDPIDLPPEERGRYRWEGPEVIYTFWAKHGPCQARGCGHRTPIFRSPVIAQKSLSTQYFDLTCPHCGAHFQADVGETRMAPGAERVVADGEPLFTELSQPVARLFKDYDKGNVGDTLERAIQLTEALPAAAGLRCPKCGEFAGQGLLKIAKIHADDKTKAANRKKKAYGLKKKTVQMWLLIHPDWLKGASGFESGQELGGYAGADAELSARWYEKRLDNLKLIEVRGNSLPDEIALADGTRVDTQKGNVPKQAHFTCATCGRENNTLEAVRPTEHTAPAAAYALQCHCPQCEAENYSYGGRYFKIPGQDDIVRQITVEKEWEERSAKDLSAYWPRQEMLFAHETHIRRPMDQHGYTHWWKMFNLRQLLVHTQLLKAMMDMSDDEWPLDVREQALGAFQQYLRNQNMFAFYHVTRDCLAPFFGNPNYHPKNLTIEVGVYSDGYGPWKSTSLGIIDGLKYVLEPWEPQILEDAEKAKSKKIEIADPVIPGCELYCGSSTDLSMLENERFDLVITDPPFGNNLFYADLADFFYVWLRIPLQQWYAGMPEAAYFAPERSPHSMEAIDNSAEHPDDRAEYEKDSFISGKYLAEIRALSGDEELQEKDANPLYRTQPSSEFYCQTLAACWTEAGRLLKDGGIMAFTFHHNEDNAWIDVLQALFDSGYVLTSTYPIRSDETKGENAAFGSQKIEYDIIHVCRKRLEEPEPVAYVRMRRWVKEEAERLKTLLEQTHGKSLPESDLRVILRGKCLEFYSRHYGQVFTGEGQALDVRHALLGINQILDDILESASGESGLRPPDSAEPASRLFLNIFKQATEIQRDDLHKRLRGTGIAQSDFEARGWIKVTGKTVHLVPVQDRFAFFTATGRNRKIIKTDLDQAVFCIGAALKGMKLEAELNNPNFRVKKSVDDLLLWQAHTNADAAIRQAAQVAYEILSRHRRNEARKSIVPTQGNLFEYLEAQSS